MIVCSALIFTFLCTLILVTCFGFLLFAKSFQLFIGKVAMEGKVEHKFDMKPHEQNIEEYHKLCRERTKKSMVKIRQIQVED